MSSWEDVPLVVPDLEDPEFLRILREVFTILNEDDDGTQ